MQQMLIGRFTLKGAECKYPYKDTAVWAHPITGNTLNARQTIFHAQKQSQLLVVAQIDQSMWQHFTPGRIYKVAMCVYI